MGKTEAESIICLTDITIAKCLQMKERVRSPRKPAKHPSETNFRKKINPPTTPGRPAVVDQPAGVGRPARQTPRKRHRHCTGKTPALHEHGIKIPKTTCVCSISRIFMQYEKRLHAQRRLLKNRGSQENGLPDDTVTAEKQKQRQNDRFRFFARPINQQKTCGIKKTFVHL